MKVELLPGKYVLAVSGGVDSMVLLDILAGLPSLELVVAHFDHGIRLSSAHDADFVAAAARRYRLPFELGHGELGAKASEEIARKARYLFLNDIRVNHGADAIITAHHQDDLIETAVINLLRGTGPQGIYAMLDNPSVIRPLINFSKAQIIGYAKQHGIRWREDETNADSRYLRNRVRQNLVAKLADSDRRTIVGLIKNIMASHEQTKKLVARLSDRVLIDSEIISRQAFIGLPPEVSRVFMHDWLSRQGITDLDRPTIERLSLAVKTGLPGTILDIKKGAKLELALSVARLRGQRK